MLTYAANLVCWRLAEQPVCAVHIQVDAAEAVTGSKIAKQVLHFSSPLLMCCSAPMLYEDNHLFHDNDCWQLVAGVYAVSKHYC